jgi:rubrerythrin
MGKRIKKRKCAVKVPPHKKVHGVYCSPRMGLADEHEAVRDYDQLEHHLLSPKSRRMVKHIKAEEKQHVKEFKAVIALEKKAKKKKRKKKR